MAITWTLYLLGRHPNIQVKRLSSCKIDIIKILKDKHTGLYKNTSNQRKECHLLKNVTFLRKKSNITKDDEILDQ